MIRDVNLIEYLPPFVQEYREIQEIMKSENPEFQIMADESEVIKNNQFIISSDLQGIKRFESILKITESTDDTLESRISRVLTRWNDTVPYTWNSFIMKLETLCGESGFTINKLFNIYKIEIETHLALYGQVDDLQYLLGYMMPSNLVIVSNNNLYFETKADIFIAAGAVYFGMFEISNDYKESYTIENLALFGGGYIECTLDTISDNYKESYTIDGTSSHGGGIVEIIEINASDNFQETMNIEGSENVGTGITYAAMESIN